jgi:transposase InsO family protein
MQAANTSVCAFSEHLALDRIAASAGSVGDAYGNCLMKSIIGLCTTEPLRAGVITKGPLRGINDVEYATMAWVDWWNHRRLHTPCGLIPPAEAEATHYQHLQPT